MVNLGEKSAPIEAHSTGTGSVKDAASGSRKSDWTFRLFALGGVVGLTNMAISPVPFGQGFEMWALATNLARNGV